MGTIFAFSSPYSKDEEKMNTHIASHGDGVRDVAFAVENAVAIYEVFFILLILIKLSFLFVIILQY